MGKIILVLGGARSGKSSFAESLAGDLGQQVGYIATAKVTDEDMRYRIEKHKEQRPSHWVTFEAYKGFETLKQSENWSACDTFLLDCVTIMVSNIMFEADVDYDTTTVEEISRVESTVHSGIESLFETFSNTEKNLILVSNEVGLGLVPSYRLGNYFRDIAGRVNQKIAREANDVYFVVSGIPIKIK